MSEQNLANHKRYDALYHFFAAPVLAINIIVTLVQLGLSPTLSALWSFIVAIALGVVVWRLRVYPIRVQDRVIRLEERLRLRSLLPAELHPQIDALSHRKLAALRFSSDEELPALVEKLFKNELRSSTDIKQAIAVWRADEMRV